MALRIQAANAPVVDSRGLFHCTIVKVKPIPGTGPYGAPRYEWTFEGKGTIRTYGVILRTPSDLGLLMTGYDEKDLDETDLGEEDAVYNALAQLLLGLDLVTPEALGPDHIETTIANLDLESAIGLCVTCQLAKKTMTVSDRGIERKVPYIALVLSSLALDKEPTAEKPRKEGKHGK